LFAIRSSDSKVRTLTQMEALKLTENDQNSSVVDLPDHHDLVAEIVKGTLYPQAAQKPLRINVGPRKKLLNFFDASISELELDDSIRLESNLLHNKAIDHALLKTGETLVNQVLLRLAKGFINPRDALLEFIESNKLGNLLDTENQGLRKFELMVSLGTIDKA
jgi:hypothetical protein